MTHSIPSPARPLGARRAPRGPIEGPRERERIRTAGDLFDPHGTHRMCRAAVARALEQYGPPPFPGAHDDREFWQRVEARNLETAARADRLGLPEYFAMEAYVVTHDGAAGS